MNGEIIKSILQQAGITPASQIHKNAVVVQLHFAYDKDIIAIIKRNKGAWSKSLNNWYVPKDKRLLEKITIEIGALKNIETKRDEVKQMVRLLELKSYSPNTINNYTGCFSLFLDHIHPRAPASMDKKAIEDYLLYLAKERKESESAIHSAVNAIKFYYEQVLKKPREFYAIERPKKPLQIPRMFSKEEIALLLKTITNLKHKTILILCYSSGLRVSEVASLRVRDIDSKRMVLNILHAKGKKDRIVPLSPTTLKYLREYYIAYKPTDYIFESQNKKEAYSTRSIQIILSEAKKKAGILKPGSVHALRHSYATHLLDKGVDITYIQKILGHNNLKTTLRYLHVTIRDLVRIESPIEELDL